MKLLSSLLTKKPVIIALVFIVVMIAMIVGATKMKVATGNETLMSIDSKVYKDNQELEKHFGGESIILFSTSHQDHGILTVGNLQRMEELGNLLKQYDAIYSFISPASIVNQLTIKQFEKMSGSLADIEDGLQDMGGKLTEIGVNMEQKMYKSNSSELVEKMGGKLLEISSGLATLTSYSDIAHSGLPSNSATLNTLLYDQGKLRSIFDELILDDKHSVMMIKLKGNTNDQEKDKIIDTIKEQLKRTPFEGADTIITGKPIMDSAVHASMQESMKKMIGIAIVLMLIVLMIVFHVRWRVLAIPVILLSVLAALGLMGHVNVPMTMVSMAVFPILIGLGVDYAIQFQNRYEEERNKEETVDA